MPIHIIMRLYPKKQSVQWWRKPVWQRKSTRQKNTGWWRKPEWWQLIVAVIAILPTVAYFIKPVFSSPLAPKPIHTVPAEWYKDKNDAFDSVKTVNHNLLLKNNKLLDSIDYLNNNSLELDIRNLDKPPASFRFIADSLESLIEAGLTIAPETLLRIGNACFALGDFEQAERYYLRVPSSAQYSSYISPFEIALFNRGVVNGVLGSVEDRQRLIDDAHLYGKMRLLALGISY